jgi:hypothetical protein
MGTPAAVSFGAQALLVALADLFQDVAHTIEVGDLPAHLSQLIGMDGKLTGFAAGIIYIQHPLAMTFAAGAGGARDAGGMEGMAFEQRATQQVIEGRELAEKLLEGEPVRTLRHLHRCYIQTAIQSIHFF